MQLNEYATNATESFVLPDICMQVRQMLDDNNSSIEDLAEVVSLDPALASKMLKLANSALFRFPSQVDSLTKALNVIGGEALFNLLMAETARSAFEHFDNDQIDLKRFWLFSIYSGLIAKHLAKICKIRGTERFFLLGLLHNLGQLVIAKLKPELAQQCAAFDKLVSPWRRQRQVLGFSYAQCSSEILRMWQLPTQLYMPVGAVHDENLALTSKEIGIIFTSVRAATALVETELYTVNQLSNPLVVSHLKLDESDLLDALKFARMEADNIFSILHFPGS